MQSIGVFFVFIFLSLNVQALEIGIVSGSLDLNVPGNSSVYVQFSLLEVQSDESKVIVAQQPFVKTEQNKIPFTINYNAQNINPERHYKLAVIVASDSKGKSILGQHDFPIITHGKPTELNIAIDIAPEPIE